MIIKRKNHIIILLAPRTSIHYFRLIHPGRIIFGFGHIPATVRALDIWFIKSSPAGRTLILVRSEEVRLLDPVCIFPFSEHDTIPP